MGTVEQLETDKQLRESKAGARDVARLVEYLPSICEALASHASAPGANHSDMCL